MFCIKKVTPEEFSSLLLDAGMKLTGLVRMARGIFLFRLAFASYAMMPYL